MKAQLGWLREHVDLHEDAEEVGRRLTALGFALDGLEGAGDDAVLDLDVGSNRPDALSHVGLARELAAALGRPLRVTAPIVPESSDRAQDVARVVVEAPDACPRYAARVVRGVRPGPSPAWMARRLEACGVRPIDVVVDVTNFVLLELGHPLHAFDLDRLAQRTIVVRRARAEERLTTLDGVERPLHPETLLIADAERGVAVAGIMGGADSEITAGTRDVLVESAYFDPITIRRGARRLGMHTEASHRFERGTDRDAVRLALDRAVQLLGELAGGTVLAGAIDVEAPAPPLREVRLRRARLRALAGVEVPDAEVERILSALGFEAARADEASWSVRVPRRRGDVAREVDLVEEVLRVHGYDRVPATLPPFREGARPRAAWERGLDGARRTLAATGWLQAVSLSLEEPAACARWGGSILEDGADRVLVIENPLGEGLGALRTSLLPGLLRALSTAVRRGEDDVRLFEEGAVFAASREVTRAAEERPALALIATGRRRPAHFSEPAAAVDVLVLEGAVVEALVAAGAPRESIRFEPAQVPWCAPGAAGVSVGGVRAGWIGRLHPDVLRPLEVDAAAHAAEIDLTRALAGERPRRRFEVPSRYPSVVRDASVFVDRRQSYGAIIAAIEALRESSSRQPDGAPIESVRLVDRWLGKGVPEGKVSLTFSVSYRSPDRTLTQDEVDRRHAELVAALERQVGAVLRTS